MAGMHFDAIFDLLDPASQGHISLNDVHQFVESINFNEVDVGHVRCAAKQINGSSSGSVKKEEFAQVLQETSRRVQVEEVVRWDFRALDSNGSHRISIQDALLLFQNTHGKKFSMKTWRKFLASRDDSIQSVCFDEMRMLLCEQPSGPECGANEIKTEMERLADLQNKNTTDEYEEFQNSLPEAMVANRKEEHEVNVKRGARRKFNKWEKEGVRSVLYDDGIDRGEDVSGKTGASLGINDLLDRLEMKYRMLRTKLFWNMIHKQSGVLLLSDSEQVDAFQQLELREKQMRGEGTLAQCSKELPGAHVSHPLPIVGLMGGLKSQLDQLGGELSERRMELRNSGRDESGVEQSLRNEFELKIKGPVNSAGLLIELHSRWQEEKDELITRLRSNQSTSKNNQAVIEFCRLERQFNCLELEEEFHSAASSTGIAERPQEAKYIRFNPDRIHQERLATYRLSQRKRHKLKFQSDANKVMKGTVITDLMTGVIKEMSWKQAQEREVLIQLLLGRDSAAAKASARQLSGPQRHHKVTSLRNQRLGWRNSSAQYRATHKIQQTRILQDGVGLYYESIRSTAGASDNVICSFVLADLQQAQDEEFENLLNSLHGKKEKEIENMITAERSSRKEEQLDTLARVLLGVFEMAEDEKPFIEALDAKYDALRHVLLLHALRAEYGLAWQRLKDDEKQRLLVKRQNEEQRLRHDGRFAEMGQIITAVSENIVGSLRKLMGENRQEFYQRQALYTEKKDHADVHGLNADATANDEAPEEKTPISNLLADLLQRYYVEQDALMGYIRSSEFKIKGHSQQQIPLVRLKLETKICGREESFEIAAMAVGLMERVEAAVGQRHLSDIGRQESLSALRMEARKQRVDIGEPHQKELDEYARPEKGNSMAWMESFIWEQNKKHVEERELLLSIIQDPGLEELMEVARTMAPSDRSTRLAELRTKRNNMNIDSTGEKEENFSIIEEAAAIRCVIKREHLTSKRADVSHRDITIMLLKELQDEQDRETATYISKLADMTEEEMKKSREYEINSRHWQAGENVIHVLTRHEGEAEDDVLLKALEEKYDAMRDKLLIEALMKQYGENEWKSLTEKERQQKLVQLKLREKQLRREGKLEELAKLLGDSLARDVALRKMMGESRGEYERRLQDKLARRQKRIDEELDPDEDEQLEEEDEVDGGTGNPLVDLQSRYEEEKEALLRRLRGLDNAYLSEKERQAQLLRLKREKRRAEREDKFDNAARLLGLAERQQGELSEKLKNDRLRHEQLARERLAALKKRKEMAYSEDVLRDGNQTDLQDAVMKRLDDLHAQERQLFVQFLSSLDSDEDTRLLAQASSSLERQEQLQKLRDRRQASLDSAQENHAILQEACSYKFEVRRDAIAPSKEDVVEEDDVTVTLLADLQQIQEKQAEEMLEEITDKEVSELVSIQVKLIEETKQQKSDNVAIVIFTEEKDEQNALLAALDSKYDALREKLLIEALMAQVGENEWKSLSEEERQRKLAEMKLEERKLRRAGKYNEAEKLFGDAIKNHEALKDLMGDNRMEQEKKLKERLDRRKKRKADGMSEEECDKLEEEEIEAEEEQAKKKRNVLLDLMKNYDAERDAILKALQESESKADREKRRQLEMARLKREERRAKSEAKYDAAAIVLGLAQKQKETMETERIRQEQLAKERLAARRVARKLGQIQESDEEVAVPDNKADMMALQDAVLREVELKQNSERALLLQVMEGALNCEAIQNMNTEQQGEKLEELRQLRSLWRQQPEGNSQEQMEYFTNGIGFRMESTKRKMEAEGKSHSEEAIQIALLADLQQHQEHETRAISDRLGKADADCLLEIKEFECLSRKNQWYDSMAIVVFGEVSSPEAEGLSQEEKEVVHSLEKKYDAARDKLFIEALMKEAGEREWAMLTKQEQHKRLVKLRLEEKQLRREGKYNEAAHLLGKMAKYQEALNHKLGESRSVQQKRLEEQLRRRSAMKAERETQGLSTDEALINALVDQEIDGEEEKKIKNQNVLENLSHHYEDEKEALLAALRGQEDRDSAERERQLQLAKLRRDQKLMEKEDKFDSAAIILSLAEKNEKKREDGFVMERERQRQLAQERLCARRQKKTDDKEEKGSERLKQAEEKLKAALEATSDDIDGVLLQDALLNEIEEKQATERDSYMDLLNELENDKRARADARKHGEKEARMQLEQYRQDRTRWQKESRKAHVRLGEGDTVAETEKESIRKAIQDGRQDQKKILLSALAIRMEMEVAALRKVTPGESEESLRADASLSLLTELQIKQKAETSALEKIIPDKDEKMLTKLKDNQHMSKIYGWLENLNSTVFTLPTNMEDLSQEDEGLPENKETLEKSLEDELEREKEEYKKKLLESGNDVDVEAALKELEEQQAAKRKALQDAMAKQQKQLKERLDARRTAQEAAEYEEEMAIALVRNAEREHSFVLEKKHKERNRQQDLMQQRLAARRDARRNGQGDLSRESSDTMSDLSSRTSTPTLPGGRMRREKTALDVEVSEDQKKELFSQVVREHADWTRKISADKQRQQEVLQMRLRNRTNKRQEEVEAVFSLGQRQKTILQKTKQEERERQITAMKERVARVRYERTMTMKDLGDKNARQFDELLGAQSSEQLTEDEKMSLAAKKMQQKFQEDEETGGLKSTAEEGSGREDGAEMAQRGSEAHVLSREEKMAVLKQRRLEKKRQRQEAAGKE